MNEIEQNQFETGQIHAKLNLAYAEKSVGDLMANFSKDFVYQVGGQELSYSQFQEKESKYFSRIRSHESSTIRLSSRLEGETFIERIRQQAKVTIMVFIFIRKKFKIQRETEYHWIRENGVLKISRIMALAEPPREDEK